MSYPLVRELAEDGIPVTVTCRVLKIARQPYYRWLANPLTDAEWAGAHLANALFDAHRDDPEFGYRFLADEAREAGLSFADRTAWRICRDNGWWSVFGKRKRGKKAKVGGPAHDDLVRRTFSAAAPNRLWLTDLTEHPTPWIPAVVATPDGGVGDAGSEVQRAAEGHVLLVDRSWWDSAGGGKGGGGARGRGLHVVTAGGSVDAARDAAQIHRAGQGGVLPAVGAEPERLRDRP
jgi:hypothetical protein